jgi:hypothetical protein
MHIRATPRLYKIVGRRERGLRDETIRKRSTSLQFQANALVGTPTTSGGLLSTTNKGGTTAEPQSVRTSGARPVGKSMAARDTDNNRVLSHFMQRFCASRVFQSTRWLHSSAGTPPLDAAKAPSLQPEWVANCFRKVSTDTLKTPMNHRLMKRRKLSYEIFLDPGAFVRGL